MGLHEAPAAVSAASAADAEAGALTASEFHDMSYDEWIASEERKNYNLPGKLADFIADGLDGVDLEEAVKDWYEADPITHWKPDDRKPTYKHPLNNFEYLDLIDSVKVEMKKHGIAVDDAGRIKLISFPRFNLVIGGWKRTRGFMEARLCFFMYLHTIDHKSQIVIHNHIIISSQIFLCVLCMYIHNTCLCVCLCIFVYYQLSHITYIKCNLCICIRSRCARSLGTRS